MSLGGNFSSGYTNTLIDAANTCEIPKQVSIAYANICCDTPVNQQSARYPSMVLSTNKCPPPTPAEFAKYPKVAVPSSVRTEALVSGSRCPPINPVTRFAQYNRYQVPVPCPPLPDSSRMAGISLPSSRACNL